MKIDCLVAEIGSTTTLINAFMLGAKPKFIGQGFAPTTVEQGDVCIGLNNAIDSLAKTLGEKVTYKEMLATSSAAGGLKMTVHGLVYEMTVRAAKEAALGAGGIIKLLTAGKLSQYDLGQIIKTKPNLILLAGGTDYGATEVPLYNAELLAKADLPCPIVYAGNKALDGQIAQIFEDAGKSCKIVDNVYPQLDNLCIEPTRKVIHSTFEQNIVKAQGMEHIRKLVSGNIIPTPGAVMECAMLASELLGNIAVIDIGGATTDIHSVCDDNAEMASLAIEAEPHCKRTVEGDLGVYINARHLIDLLGEQELSAKLGFDIVTTLAEYKAIPVGDKQIELVEELTLQAGKIALTRHAGSIRYIFGNNGRQTLTQGKDLTDLKYLIASGGALTRLPHREQIMRNLANINANKTMLFPKVDKLQILFDNDYIMASLGVLAKTHKDEAIELLKQTLSIK
ncbi:MAG: GlmL-related ornithine degradation protein [Clostridia bacterium]